MARPGCYQSSTLGSTERSFASDSFPGKQQQLVSSIGVVEEENTLGSVRGQRRPVSLQIHNQHHQRASSSALSRTIQENDYDSIPARYLAFAIYHLNATYVYVPRDSKYCPISLFALAAWSSGGSGVVGVGTFCSLCHLLS